MDQLWSDSIMHATAATTACLLSCRAGMESDCAAEIIERAAGVGTFGWCRTGDGYVEYTPNSAAELGEMAASIRFTSLVFPRQWSGVIARCEGLPPHDRAGALAQVCAPHVDGYGELRIEFPDTPEGRPLSRLARALREPVRAALHTRGIRQHSQAPTLHVFLTAGDAALVTLSNPRNASAWLNGIPRLRMPAQAPSRSLLKLDEALGLFLDDAERAQWLAPGRRAVDLGAAPGGWTWLLAERGLQVDAVDNGSLAPGVHDHARVKHYRADGFTFRPRGRADWLVCDMVERPQRIAGLTAEWLQTGRCHHAVVNLKLPMKQRWPTVRDQLERIREILPASGRLSARQLYHDREEITVFATRLAIQRN